MELKEIPIFTEYLWYVQKHIGKAYPNEKGQLLLEFFDGCEMQYSEIKNNISIQFEAMEYVKNKQCCLPSVKKLRVKKITFKIER